MNFSVWAYFALLVALVAGQTTTSPNSTTSDTSSTTTISSSTSSSNSSTTTSASTSTSSSNSSTTTPSSSSTTPKADDAATLSCRDRFKDRQNVTGRPVRYFECRAQCSQPMNMGFWKSPVVIGYIDMITGTDCGKGKKCVGGTCTDEVDVTNCMAATNNTLKRIVPGFFPRECEEECVGNNGRKIINSKDGKICQWMGSCKNGKCEMPDSYPFIG